MRGMDAIRLVLLAAIWGASFIFIRVAAPVLGPVVTVETRVMIAGLLLLVYTRLTGLELQIRERWKLYLAIGTLSSAIPFALISAAELNLSASMAAILNATTPLFGALVAAIWLGDTLTPKKIVGLCVSFVGVIVLVGWSRLGLTFPVAFSIGASLLASLTYGIGAAFTKKFAQGAPAMGMALGSQIGATVFLAPAVPFTLPSAMPPSNVIACVSALGVFCTGIAYVLYFRLIVDVGPARTLTVTFWPRSSESFGDGCFWERPSL